MSYKKPVSKKFLDSLNRDGIKLKEEIALAETWEDILSLECKMYPNRNKTNCLDDVLQKIAKELNLEDQSIINRRNQRT